MTYHAANHWRAFRSGAKTYCSRRTLLCTNKFRDRVIDVALDNWPAPEARGKMERYEYAGWIYNDRDFRRELGLSPIVWWLMSLVIKAIIDALIDYWFETKETEGQA